MSEIKFKQAIFIYGEFRRWHYWGLIDGAFVGIDTGNCSPTDASNNSYQYIGLHDKNGVEIYEGYKLLTDEADWKAQVVYRRDTFMLIGLDGRGFSVNPNWEECEVFGNIHEELLK